MNASLFALGAIALWATLALLGVRLSHLPPFLLTGLGLVIGSLVALPLSGFDPRRWRVPASTLALGIYGLFGFHLLLFLALRYAPPIEANLVNYLWPLLMVVLAPLILPGLRLRAVHVLAALGGFLGAGCAIAGGRELEGLAWGYLPALGSAFIWATYSLLTKRVKTFPTAAIGGFCLAAGALSLTLSALFESPPTLTGSDLGLLALLGLGPLGGAFFLWDRALKLGDPRRLGVLAFVTPLASTLLLMLDQRQPPTAWTAAAVILILGSSLVAIRAT